MEKVKKRGKAERTPVKGCMCVCVCSCVHVCMCVCVPARTCVYACGCPGCGIKRRSFTELSVIFNFKFCLERHS